MLTMEELGFLVYMEEQEKQNSQLSQYESDDEAVDLANNNLESKQLRLSQL